MKRKKYFKSKKEALNALNQYNEKGFYGLHVYKMPKGTRKAGWYAVCTEIDFFNTY